MNKKQLKNNREKCGHPLLTEDQVKDIWECTSLNQQPIMQFAEYVPPPFEMPLLVKTKEYGYSVCVMLKISPKDVCEWGKEYESYLDCAKEYDSAQDHFNNHKFYLLPDSLIGMFYSSNYEGVADYIDNAGSDEMHSFYSTDIEQWCFVE